MKTLDVFRALRRGTRPTESGGGGTQRLLHQAEDWEFFLQQRQVIENFQIRVLSVFSC